ncbi:hypothetical protein [Microseira wollei]|uniref:hypothetical protein n=1 Tax=Microseira wollei TaxID=467598 RepID=UPI001CFD0415|nr:hypothetical protein [Microseira wollei]
MHHSPIEAEPRSPIEAEPRWYRSQARAWERDGTRWNALIVLFQRTLAISQGFKPLAGDAPRARSES